MKPREKNRSNHETPTVGGRRRSRFHSKIGALSAAVMVFLGVACYGIPAMAGCPSQAQVKEQLERLTQDKVEVIAVQRSALPGICEVAFRLRSRLQMAYIDADGSHFFFGKIVEADTGRNLTDESLAEINRLSAQEMEELPALTPFSIGSDTAQVLYYVTDPQCPYCKTGEDDLKRMAAQGTVHVRFLLLPLDFHKGAKEQCISVVCDKKGLEDFEGGYRSKNQCEEGRILVESTVDLLKKKGITGTPAYIFGDGRIHIGVLRSVDLERWLKSERKADKQEMKAPVSKDSLPTQNK